MRAGRVLARLGGVLGVGLDRAVLQERMQMDGGVDL
jgi:hypothetical protein